MDLHAAFNTICNASHQELEECRRQIGSSTFNQLCQKLQAIRKLKEAPQEPNEPTQGTSTPTLISAEIDELVNHLCSRKQELEWFFSLSAREAVGPPPSKTNDYRFVDICMADGRAYNKSLTTELRRSLAELSLGAGFHTWNPNLLKTILSTESSTLPRSPVGSIRVFVRQHFDCEDRYKRQGVKDGLVHLALRKHFEREGNNAIILMAFAQKLVTKMAFTSLLGAFKRPKLKEMEALIRPGWILDVWGYYDSQRCASTLPPIANIAPNKRSSKIFWSAPCQKRPRLHASGIDSDKVPGVSKGRYQGSADKIVEISSEDGHLTRPGETQGSPVTRMLNSTSQTHADFRSRRRVHLEDRVGGAMCVEGLGKLAQEQTSSIMGLVESGENASDAGLGSIGGDSEVLLSDRRQITTSPCRLIGGPPVSNTTRDIASREREPTISQNNSCRKRLEVNFYETPCNVEEQGHMDNSPASSLCGSNTDDSESRSDHGNTMIGSDEALEDGVADASEEASIAICSEKTDIQHVIGKETQN